MCRTPSALARTAGERPLGSSFCGTHNMCGLPDDEECCGEAAVRCSDPTGLSTGGRFTNAKARIAQCFKSLFETTFPIRGPNGSFAVTISNRLTVRDLLLQVLLRLKEDGHTQPLSDARLQTQTGVNLCLGLRLAAVGNSAELVLVFTPRKKTGCGCSVLSICEDCRKACWARKTGIRCASVRFFEHIEVQ